MFLVLGLHLLLRRLYNSLLPGPTSPYGQSNTVDGGAKLSVLSDVHGIDSQSSFDRRLKFDVFFSFFFICALHGFSALKIILILSLNYWLAKKLPREYVPAATWVFNIAILFANELNQGYKYARIARFLSLQSATSPIQHWAEWLNTIGGLVPRWEVSFNVTVLRLISFNLDYYWSLGSDGQNILEVCYSMSLVDSP